MLSCHRECAEPEEAQPVRLKGSPSSSSWTLRAGAPAECSEKLSWSLGLDGFGASGRRRDSATVSRHRRQSGVTDEPPACPSVEFRLIDDLFGFRRAPRWSWQVTKFFGQMGREQLAVDQEGLT